MIKRISIRRSLKLKAAIVAVIATLSPAMTIYHESFQGEIQRPKKLPESELARATDSGEMRPICGTPLLPEFFPEDDQPIPSEKRAGGTPDSLGQIRSFFAWDLKKKTFHQVHARLARIGRYGRVYIDTSVVTIDSVLSRLANEFDNTIYPTDTRLFGAEPRPGEANEIDGDSLITILLYDIRDESYYDSTLTTFVAGYFLRDNQRPRSQFSKSNEREMVYLDIRSLATNPLLTFGTLAHEFQHLIQWNQDRKEKRWVNEGLSELAIWACGYPRHAPIHFLSNPDLSLTSFNENLEDYDKTFLFFMYLYEHFGGDSAIYAISTNPSQGDSGVVAGLRKLDKTINFSRIMLDWLVANYLDEDGDSPYGYKNLNLPKLTLSGIFTALPVKEQQEQVQHYAADYFEFNGGKNLNIIIDGDQSNPEFYARVVKFPADQSPPEVEDIQLDAQKDGALPIADFGSRIKKAALIVLHTGSSPAVSHYGFSAQGSGANTEAVELAYDDGRPFGYFQLSQGDTVLVAFDGQPGMALDSVRFKFFSPGQAEFHIWRPRGGGLPGQDLLAPFRHQVTRVANSANSFTPWETLYFGQQFVDISQTFMVGMVMGSAAPDPKLIADSTNSDPPRSLLYSAGGQGRMWYLAGGDFMLRAYISPLINDFTTPDITLGILQHPVFTENLDVYIFSPKALNPNSVAGTVAVNAIKSDLEFATLNSDNRLFQNQEVLLQKSGQVTVIGRGTHARGNIFGADTVSFAAQRVGKAAIAKITSYDRNVTLNIPAGAFTENLWVTLLPAAKARTIPGRPEASIDLPGYEQVVPGKLLGPAKRNLSTPAELRWKYGGPHPEKIFIATRGTDHWQILPTYWDSRQQEVFANITVMGEYALFLSQKDEQNIVAALPEKFMLQQNFPNPFNPETRIRFALPQKRSVTLKIYSLTGRVIRTLVNRQTLAAGWHRLTWDGRDDRGGQVATGIYLLQLQAGNFHQVKKMSLIR